MVRVILLAVLAATLFMLASPLPSHAGSRPAFVAGFPVGAFPRSHFGVFPGGFVVVNRSFVAVPPSLFPVRRVFVREVIPALIFVAPLRTPIFISAPVFVSSVRSALVSDRCFVDRFGLLRCFP